MTYATRILGQAGFLLASLFLATTAAGQQAALVTVAPVEQKPIQIANRLVGAVEPIIISTLAAEEGALLESRNFEEGQRVAKGDVLAMLDDSLLQRRLVSSQASVASASAELERSQLVAQNLERERDRIERLYNQSVANEKELLDARNAYEQAVAQVAVSEADLHVRQAAVAELQLQIEKAVIIAPFGGVVNRRFVEVGQWVRQGDPVAELVQLDPLFIRTGVPEGVVSMLKPGDEAQVTVDALGGSFTGTIAQILPVADPASRTFPVRIQVKNENQLLRPGMFARVTFSRQDENQLVVPKDAVTRTEQGTHIVVADNGAAKFVPVQLGPADELNQAVTAEGLKAGDLVVVRGNEALRPGMPVQVQNPPGAKAQGAPTQGA